MFLSVMDLGKFKSTLSICESTGLPEQICIYIYTVCIKKKLQFQQQYMYNIYAATTIKKVARFGTHADCNNYYAHTVYVTLGLVVLMNKILALAILTFGTQTNSFTSSNTFWHCHKCLHLSSSVPFEMYTSIHVH